MVGNSVEPQAQRPELVAQRLEGKNSTGRKDSGWPSLPMPEYSRPHPMVRWRWRLGKASAHTSTIGVISGRMNIPTHAPAMVTLNMAASDHRKVPCRPYHDHRRSRHVHFPSFRILCRSRCDILHSLLGGRFRSVAKVEDKSFKSPAADVGLFPTFSPLILSVGVTSDFSGHADLQFAVGVFF